MMTLERLKAINEHAERVEQLERDLTHLYDGRVTLETRTKIDELVKQDLEVQLAAARQQFEAA